MTNPRIGSLVLLAGILVSAGCSSNEPTLVPVSGKITYQNKPLSKAWVMFTPTSKSINTPAGPASTGKTDEQGNFTLVLVDDPTQKGATLGKHVVRINLLGAEAGGIVDESRDADDPKTIAARKNAKRLPMKYNDSSELTFDVPPGGTSTANFDLK